jgi:hypothetical protein
MLNGGTLDGHCYLSPTTIKLMTPYVDFRAARVSPGRGAKSSARKGGDRQIRTSFFYAKILKTIFCGRDLTRQGGGQNSGAFCLRTDVPGLHAKS